ncbi:PREDICTED: LOW QUALITY PROTEIN: glutamate-rich protein 1 [Rhinopithecus bieti]|uniref:LOW QUALITY PROTEIN: glutamate-rich protein 1 n=1 Tax=Rhinopithecus bieti TaxID=61621 RepID=UPI00083C4DB7|nr:PREDICTED: LOW QUALITY PROTEIN: glutamate-rich protein 1 [Rhinopithecus bieti]
MAAHRKHVFVEKVLQRLFPRVPSGQGKREPQTLAVQNPPTKVTSEKVSRKHAQPLTDASSETPTARRLYTASGPPEGYVPCWPEPSSCGSPENASSGDDTEDQDPHDQPKRRRIRKHESQRKKLKNPSRCSCIKAELSRNSRGRKTLKTPGRREVLDSWEEDPTPAREGGRSGATLGRKTRHWPGRENGADTSEEESAIPAGRTDGARPGEEDDTVTDEKAASVLNFLKSTQEMYFYDGVSRDAASAALADAAEELLDRLASHSMPPSDVSILHHLKTLLLLQDTERLKRALEMFPEHCTMPPDHARVISAFFSYWITRILPEKSSD